LLDGDEVFDELRQMIGERRAQGKRTPNSEEAIPAHSRGQSRPPRQPPRHRR
jgi:hypothetical protein